MIHDPFTICAGDHFAVTCEDRVATVYIYRDGPEVRLQAIQALFSMYYDVKKIIIERVITPEEMRGELNAPLPPSGDFWKGIAPDG